VGKGGDLSSCLLRAAVFYEEKEGKVSENDEKEVQKQ
jgi:hypothetical protein